jgi:hypothetical protein
MRVKGPNGLVLTVADEIGNGLVGSPSGEYVEVKEASTQPTKKSASGPKQQKS